MFNFFLNNVCIQSNKLIYTKKIKLVFDMFFSRLKFLLTRSFTWWNGQTWGTWLFTRRCGIQVGTDDVGNLYYVNADKSRRWVIYPKYSEASSVPPDWHAWLHKMVDTPPSKQAFVEKSWEKPHQDNATGTPDAYTPPASLSKTSDIKRRKASGDYEAWKPN
ncbi:MAG: NADH:ubiquinone oxidoreductase subunit [Dasania sp.]|jgi:NADH:ubiquinone oxidoreductase subunit